MRNVRFWPKADIPSCTAHVRFRGESGHDRLRKSAFAVVIGGKADMTYCAAYVRFWPKADICSQKISPRYGKATRGRCATASWRRPSGSCAGAEI